jgi:hypothetical protein
MIKRENVTNMVRHNTYGFCAHFRFFRKAFWTPLKTDNLEQAAWRIDVVAEQLSQYFQEPRALNCPDDEALTLAQIRAETLFDDFRLSHGAFEPRALPKFADEWNKRSDPLGWKSFMWHLRRTQCNVALWAEELNIDLSQIAIRRQQSKKQDVVVLKARAIEKELVDTHKQDKLLFQARSLKSTAQHQLMKHAKLVSAVGRTGNDFAAASYQYQVKTRFDQAIVHYKELERLAAETVDLIEKANEGKA